LYKASHSEARSTGYTEILKAAGFDGPRDYVGHVDLAIVTAVQSRDVLCEVVSYVYMLEQVPRYVEQHLDGLVKLCDEGDTADYYWTVDLRSQLVCVAGMPLGWVELSLRAFVAASLGLPVAALDVGG
jgi:hypothetical protein